MNPLIPPGAAFFSVTGNPGGTGRFAFLLCPSFTFLAFASALEPLRIANQLSQRPLFAWSTLSRDGAAVPSSSGVAVAVDGGPADIARDDVLVVCSGNMPDEAAHPAILAAVNRHARHGGTVIGLCTGAVALAAAGLLSGRRFTLHWENQPGFREAWPDLAPTANKYEIDGRIITCGGGAAATDLMLDLIARDHGTDFAAMVSDMCLRRVNIGTDPAQRSSIAAVVQSRNPVLVRIVALMRQNLEEPLSMDALAERAGYSRRHMERLFRVNTGQTPAEFYRNLRLDHGRALLAGTDLTLSEVTAATGFECKAHFAKLFTRRFGMPPGRLRGTRKAASFAR